MSPAVQLSRRSFLRISLATGTLLLLPERASAGTTLINPYSGALPLVFPLQTGTYQTPVADNWHAAREGQLYAWTHRANKLHRAHDGVDVYPIAGEPLPMVYAPLAATVAAVCTRSSNTVDASVTYRVSGTTPPPWDYSQAIDTVANLPLYGNFVWLRSTDPNSAGYFVFFCHLQNEPALAGLVPDQPVSTTTAMGVMGDTGNAVGTPQLHTEIHYPIGASFTCTRCSPKKVLTSIDSFASLAAATLRA